MMLNIIGSLFAAFIAWLLVVFFLGIWTSSKEVMIIIVYVIGPIIGIIVFLKIYIYNNKAAKLQTKLDLEKNISICFNCKSQEVKLCGTFKKPFTNTKIETRVTKHYNKDDEEIGHSDTDFEVEYDGIEYSYAKECKSCGHQWIDSREYGNGPKIQKTYKF